METIQSSGKISDRIRIPYYNIALCCFSSLKIIMKFKFEKFGFVDQGELEVGDLTFICGANNVGKTYVAYAIYGFIKHFKNLVNLSISSEQIETLKIEGSLTIDLRAYHNKLAEYLKRASDNFTQKIENYFKTSSDFFANSKIELLNDNFRLDLSHEFKGKVKFGERETLIFDKASDSEQLSVALTLIDEIKVPSSILEEVINDAISTCLFSPILPNPFVITSERTGIALFYKELDLN
ncbi:MAG: hypothetical protein AB4058_02125, partial [Microcystaceae cyanobacterium]